MYYDFFGFKEPPFSIAPDPRYLYLSDRHKEALAHLMYGVQGQGGFIVITGEVGTGKTTVSRCFIENAPEHADIALILNPRLSARELLSSICDELKIPHPDGATIKQLVGLINEDLLNAYAAGRHKVLMIDEAQNLSADVLEQLRLLTNLETTEKKLLQIVLLGQPELQEMLGLPQLRQLNQRVTARYHLEGLGRGEIEAYIRYRLSVAGLRGEIFSDSAVRALYRHSEGIPRLINLISDRALLGAYAENEHHISARHIRTAAREVAGEPKPKRQALRSLPQWALFGAAVIIAAIVMVQWWQASIPPTVADADAAVFMGNDKFVGNVQRVVEEAAPPEPEPTSLSFQFENRFTSLADAFQSLFDIWGFQYSVSDSPMACEFASAQGLACLENRGSRSGLLFQNRPAILELRNDAGEKGFLVLEELQGQQAVIIGANGRSEVAFDSVEAYWHGQYTLLWQRPRYGSVGQTAQTDGLADEEIWMSARLMELAGQQSASRTEENRVMRMSTDEQIRWYQSKKGLVVDGIAGSNTIIQMNNDLNARVPRLTAADREG